MISSGLYKEKLAEPSLIPNPAPFLLYNAPIIIFFNFKLRKIYMNIKLSILKYKIQWHLVHAQCHTMTTSVKFQNIFITPNH